MSVPLEPQLDELRRRARRRLIGAIVLALAAAVVVPMLLESEPRPLGENVSVKIPPIDDGRFVNKLGEPVKAPGAAIETPAPAANTAEASPATAAPADSTAPAKDTETARVPKPPPPSVAATKPSPESTNAAAAAKKPSAPATKAAAYSVQLGAFTDDKGANALAGRLRKAGHPAYTEPHTTAAGATVWRVRVGPYPTRDAAEASRTRLLADGQNGIIAAVSNP